MNQNNLTSVDWSQIPIPEDDGGADHLQDKTIPSVPLTSTCGKSIDLAKLSGVTIIFAYPMTGDPTKSLPEGWDDIPGARGCTPQSCSFGNLYTELKQLGINQLYGLSTQSTEYQREAVNRLNLPYNMLSDANLKLKSALNLPTFNIEGMILLKRLTMIINDSKIIKVFYPVFPPDKNAETVLKWLKATNLVQESALDELARLGQEADAS